MAYGLETLRNFDRGYSEKIRDLYQRLHAHPMMTALGGGSPSFDGVAEISGESRNPVMDNVIASAIPISSGVVKYGVPAAGVTAAGMGLHQLTNDYMAQSGGPADYQEPGQIELEEQGVDGNGILQGVGTGLAAFGVGAFATDELLKMHDRDKDKIDDLINKHNRYEQEVPDYYPDEPVQEVVVKDLGPSRKAGDIIGLLPAGKVRTTPRTIGSLRNPINIRN